MDKLLTVTQVSRACGVSARMLRYYEKEGLIASQRVENYAYRVYTPENVTRLVQILVLMYAVASVLGVFLGDLLVAFVDPRIKLTKKEE